MITLYTRRFMVFCPMYQQYSSSKSILAVYVRELMLVMIFLIFSRSTSAVASHTCSPPLIDNTMSLSKPFTLLRMVKKICLVISRGLIEDCGEFFVLFTHLDNTDTSTEFVTVTPPRSHTPARPSRRYMRRQTKSSSAYVSGGIAMDTTSFRVLDQNGQV
jgi:hypothetical protein